MRLLLFGWLEFETDDVPPDELEELKAHADLRNKSLQSLMEERLRTFPMEAFFTPVGERTKNFDLNCSNFPQFANSRTKH